jgi:DNA-binding MarR family transcriptional regulator
MMAEQRIETVMEFPTLTTPTIEWVKSDVLERLERNIETEGAFVASLVMRLAQARVALSPGDSELRAWHELVRDVAAMVRASAPELAAELRRFSDALRRTIMMTERNPPSQLALRPTSRRVLQAIERLGGADVSQSDVRALVNQKEQHFSNILRLLREARFVESGGDDEDGRLRRLSLTSLGREALRVVADETIVETAQRPRIRAVRHSSSDGFRPSVKYGEAVR